MVCYNLSGMSDWWSTVWLTLEGDIVGGGGEAPLEVCTLFHRLNRFKSFPNTTKDQVHESHIFRSGPKMFPSLFFTLLILRPHIHIPLYSFHSHMNWSNTFRPNVIRRSGTAHQQSTSLAPPNKAICTRCFRCGFPLLNVGAVDHWCAGKRARAAVSTRLRASRLC